MGKNDAQINSMDIQKLLTVAISGKSESAEQLKRLLRDEYESIMTLIQQRPALSSLVIKMKLENELEEGTIKKFRSAILDLMEIDDNPERDLAEENHGNPKLEKLAIQINVFYNNSTWFLNTKILATLAKDFIEEIIRKSSKEESGGDEGTRSGNVATMKFTSSFDDEDDEDDFDDEDEGLELPPGDMHTINNLQGILQSYVEFLEKHPRRNISEILAHEKEGGRWQDMLILVRLFKTILSQHQLMRIIKRSYYSFHPDMRSVLNAFDSYAIYLGEKD